VQLCLAVCDYKLQHLALRVDANMVADVCKNHRGETVFVVKSAQGKLFILPHFCHPSILNHHPSPSCLSVLDRTSHLAMAY